MKIDKCLSEIGRVRNLVGILFLFVDELNECSSDVPKRRLSFKQVTAESRNCLEESLLGSLTRSGCIQATILGRHS